MTSPNAHSGPVVAIAIIVLGFFFLRFGANRWRANVATPVTVTGIIACVALGALEGILGALAIAALIGALILNLRGAL